MERFLCHFYGINHGWPKQFELYNQIVTGAGSCVAVPALTTPLQFLEYHSKLHHQYFGYSKVGLVQAFIDFHPTSPHGKLAILFRLN